MADYKSELSQRFQRLFRKLKEEKIIRTQKEMAEKINVTEGTIRNYLKEKREPGAEVISKVCQTFNVNPSWLLWEQGEQGEIFQDNIDLELSETDRTIISFFKMFRLNDLNRFITKAAVFSNEEDEKRELWFNISNKFQGWSQDQQRKLFHALRVHLLLMHEERFDKRDLLFKLEIPLKKSEENHPIDKKKKTEFEEKISSLKNNLQELNQHISDFISLESEKAQNSIKDFEAIIEEGE